MKERQLAHISPIAILHIKYSHVYNLILVVKYSTGSAHFIRGLDPFYSVGNYAMSGVLCGLSIPVTPT